MSVELENPYGDDANDLPLLEMQCDMNQSLLSLLHPACAKPPEFHFHGVKDDMPLLVKYDMHKHVEELRALRAREKAGDALPKADSDDSCKCQGPSQRPSQRASPLELRQKPAEVADVSLDSRTETGGTTEGRAPDPRYRASDSKPSIEDVVKYGLPHFSILEQAASPFPVPPVQATLIALFDRNAYLDTHSALTAQVDLCKGSSTGSAPRGVTVPVQMGIVGAMSETCF